MSTPVQKDADGDWQRTTKSEFTPPRFALNTEGVIKKRPERIFIEEANKKLLGNAGPLFI